MFVEQGVNCLPVHDGFCTFVRFDPVALIPKVFNRLSRLVLDNKKFIRCRFDRMELGFRGEGTIGFEHCTFQGVHFKFDGAAGLTVFQLGKIQQDEKFHWLVEELLNQPNSGGLTGLHMKVR